MQSLKKVFGIVSYFPNNDTEYHIETRRERSRRCSELLCKLSELWPEVDILIIAQNWQDYQPPEIKNKLKILRYDKLGILGARRELRKQFIKSNYDYLIMLDDDGMIQCDDPSIYLSAIDNHPGGIGVIRHTACPLMLLAISKEIYSQIDMPDMNPEISQGFEDDLFVAMCFQQFPDKAFDFPKDCVTETSFKYVGPGQCPSSWAKEQIYNWNYMRRYTAALIKATKRQHYESSDISDIDVVIPYVNARDRLWMKDYTTTTGIYTVSNVRFRDWGSLKYLLRSISDNMPFVRNVILLLARESQVPEWLNQENVKIVYHRDFIPAQFLPTFNSCTIECFLYNIPDLSEYFLYFNDDMFPINPLAVSDFFTDGKPHIDFLRHESYPTNNMYRIHCRNGLDLIASTFHKEKYPVGKLICPEHSIMPMRKSTTEIVGEACKAAIERSASMLRMPKNLNQYIYPYYEYYTDHYVNDIYGYMYIDMHESITDIRRALFSDMLQVVCLNDSDKVKDYKKTREELLKLLEEKFPNKCKYEA